MKNLSRYFIFEISIMNNLFTFEKNFDLDTASFLDFQFQMINFQLQNEFYSIL